MNTATAEAPQVRVKQKTGPKPKPEMRKEERLTSGTRKVNKAKFLQLADELGMKEAHLIRHTINIGLKEMGRDFTV